MNCRDCKYCHKLKRFVNQEWECSSVCILFCTAKYNNYDDWALELENIDDGVICECFTER